MIKRNRRTIGNAMDYSIMRRIWQSNEIPDGWKKGVTAPVYKKKD
jgi:hypothetical protein